MKSRFVVSLVAFAVVAVACSSGNPIATVGGVSITDEQVNDFYSDGEAGSEFACTIEFLISTEVFVEAARTGLGVTVTGGEIDDFIDSPPAHRADALGVLLADGSFSEDGVRAQVRRWALVDRVVDVRVGSDEQLLAEFVSAGVADMDDVNANPSAFMSLAANDTVVSRWVDELVDSDDIAEVVVDPLFATWRTADLSPRDVCVSGVLARIGDVGITEDDVTGLNDPAFPASPEQFDFQLQFLISSQIYLQEAAERFDVVITEADVDAFIAGPPAHRITDLAGLAGSGQFTEAGIKAQVRRWLVADEVVAILVVEDAEFLSAVSTATGLTVEEITADPLAFLQVQDVSSVFNTWTTEIAEAGEFTEVVIDPLVGEWDPVFRQFIPAGG